MSIEWDGEGLPPVGCEFEWSTHSNGFTLLHKRKCTAVGTSGILSVGDDGVELYLNNVNNRFFPIRTKADRMRESSVDAICDILRVDRDCGARINLVKIYEAIAAGKIPGIRLTDD